MNEFRNYHCAGKGRKRILYWKVLHFASWIDISSAVLEWAANPGLCVQGVVQLNADTTLAPNSQGGEGGSRSQQAQHGLGQSLLPIKACYLSCVLTAPHISSAARKRHSLFSAPPHWRKSGFCLDSLQSWLEGNSSLWTTVNHMLMQWPVVTSYVV